MAEKAQKLESYVWEGKDRKGNKSKGELTGSNLALVKAQLRKQGIIPDKVKKKPKPLFGGSKKITPFDIAMLTRQLATMMKAGVPLVQSFDIVADGLENKGLQELVMSIRNDISSGTSFECGSTFLTMSVSCLGRRLLNTFQCKQLTRKQTAVCGK